MKRNIIFLAIILLACVSGLRAQTAVSDADKEAIKQTALDYIEGWYEGNAERMERALHPELAKRIVFTKDVTILDVYENAACVKVVASDWVDFLQVAKYNGRWVIVNVLWELKPALPAKP